MYKTLAELSPGDTARILMLQMRGSARRRLSDIGIIPGTSVKCVMISPFGDPAAYKIRGAVIGLRLSDAEKIIIEETEVV